MRIDIISVVPELLKSPFEASILKRAISDGIVDIHIHNLREFTSDNYKSVDDYQYGGGAGMVMTVEPIDKCISRLKSERDYDHVIYMTPDGEKLNQSLANKFCLLPMKTTTSDPLAISSVKIAPSVEESITTGMLT